MTTDRDHRKPVLQINHDTGEVIAKRSLAQVIEDVGGEAASPPAQVLEILREYGWQKHTEGALREGLCLIGAYRHVSYLGYHSADAFSEVVRKAALELELWPSEWTDFSVPSFNDQTMRTFAEVEKVLIRADEIWQCDAPREPWAVREARERRAVEREHRERMQRLADRAHLYTVTSTSQTVTYTFTYHGSTT